MSEALQHNCGSISNPTTTDLFRIPDGVVVSKGEELVDEIRFVHVTGH